MKNVIKLDRRYNGYGVWTHRTDYGGYYGADARQKARLRFYEQRCFLTTQFGPGCFEWEAGTLSATGRQVPLWGFDEAGNIFLKDEALTTFILTEGRWE
jgi:hypothetical protein